MSYNTDNIAVAAALRLNGHVIENIQVNGRKATFCFDESVRDLANEIQMGNKLVDAISFHHELRRLSGLAKTMSQV